MKNPFVGRISVAQAGWVIGLLFFGWLAFVFLPWPKSDTKEPARSTPVDLRAPYRAKLLAAGLPDNPDLDGLPEMFAIWSDRADWVDGRAKFAYWNPGAQDYTYFFDAIRENGRIRFRAISKPDAYTGTEAGTDGPASSPQHPVLLLRRIAAGSRTGMDRPVSSPSQPGIKVPVEIPVELARPAPPKVEPLFDPEPKK